ncbi:hypothetical protein [Paenibacillus sp. DP01]|uniref:hypothetical protein n=1 Tax=Paenibacillus sp. DP01 TaxID=3373096 RepID=UPI00384D130C
MLEAYRSCKFECDERLDKELPFIREWLDRRQGATAARRLKHTYRKRNVFLPDCKGTKQA